MGVKSASNPFESIVLVSPAINPLGNKTLVGVICFQGLVPGVRGCRTVVYHRGSHGINSFCCGSYAARTLVQSARVQKQPGFLISHGARTSLRTYDRLIGRLLSISAGVVRSVSTQASPHTTRGSKCRTSKLYRTGHFYWDPSNACLTFRLFEPLPTVAG